MRSLILMRLVRLVTLVILVRSMTLMGSDRLLKSMNLVNLGGW